MSAALPSPVLTPAENQYCIRLADWWLERSKEFESRAGEHGSTVYQISGDDVPQSHGGGRVHRLIKEASPHAPPSGYFDCTIEVSTTQLFSHPPDHAGRSCLDIPTIMEFTVYT